MNHVMRSLRRCAANPSISISRKYVAKHHGEVEYVKSTALLITCMDSRINPHNFLKMDPGSTYIVRNPGNFILHADELQSNESSPELAGLELAVNMQKVTDIIVCGHSDCKAIQGFRSLKQCCVPAENEESPLVKWLQKNGERTWWKYLTEQENDGFSIMFDKMNYGKLQTRLDPGNHLCTTDRISQINVLQQLENICSHKFLQKALQDKSCQLHGMWLDIAHNTVHIFNWELRRFVELQHGRAQIPVQSRT